MSLFVFLFVVSLYTMIYLNLLTEVLIKYKSVATIIILTFSVFLTIFVYFKLKKMKSVQILCSFLGLFLGVSSGILLSLPLLILYPDFNFVVSIFTIAFGYAGAIFGFKKAETIKISEILWIIKKEAVWEEPKILDTNVLIDGRIADLIELGFIKGTILIPRFILREIQYISDSPDPLRRAKGKRALDILQKIQRAEKIKFEIVEKDIQEIKEIDIKLVEIARILKGTLITNDQNLIKIAQLRGVPVLNLNELAHAMRPPVLPGEVLKLFIVKEGKEPNQGVAYLDDGTMVVVEEGRACIGKTIDVVIHSVLQTGTGRMVFGKPKTDTNLLEREQRDET